MWAHSMAGGASPWISARTRLGALASLAVCVLGVAGTTHGAGRYLKVDYPGSADADKLQTPVTYTLWIPDGVPHLRCIIVHQHGAGTTASIEGSTAAYDLHWQALARKWDCALFSSSYHVTNEKIDLSPGGSELWFDPRHGSEKVFLKALDEFAATSGHPEIATVPWALWGHSGGGIWADVMSTLHPERVAAIWMRSGSAAMFRTKPEFPQPAVPAAVYGIPSMCNPGVKEKPNLPWVGPLATFQEYRANGAPIGFAPDPRTGHECGDCRYLAIPFFDACLAMRLPDKGSKDQTLKPVDNGRAWLAPLLGDQAVPAASYQGDPSKAVWLPNEAVARAWMEYVKTGAVSDTTPPPAPYDAKVTAQGDHATQIEWSANADFESGIRCFVVLRDGQELAQAPQTPVGKFGRPLFQSMTYHDTPAQPMPEMRYVDTTAKPGEKHTYAVVAVNSVGLKSEPAVASGSGAPAFDGERTTWHDGFARYDYVMDEQTLAITPFAAPPGEGFGVRDPAKSQRRCIVIAPKQAAPGNPWSWRGCYWDHQPQTEVELLRRGFHVAYISANATLRPGQEWDAWYAYLTEKHGLSKKPAFIGMSRGGEFSYTWATAHPDKVSCIYGDNPVLRSRLAKTPLENLAPLAQAGVPLLHVCGSLDPWLEGQTRVAEKRYKDLGGQITVIVKEGEGHYPTAPKTAQPIVDSIVGHAK